MAEQKDEDDHKHWYDSKLEQNNESKDDIPKANAEAARLTEYIQEEMNLRTENSAENAATVIDAQAAQQAVTDATAVLKSFSKASGMTAREPHDFV